MSSELKKAVFLDRDGVINNVFVRGVKPHPPASLAEYRILDGVLEAIIAFKAAGYLVIVVTNQPDVGNGIQTREVVEELHAYVRDNLPVDDIYACFHKQTDGCDCRKPKPGMLTQAAEKWNIDLKTSFMVGDRWSDLKAGRAAVCKTVLIGDGYPAELKPGVTLDFDIQAPSLLLASGPIIASESYSKDLD